MRKFQGFTLVEMVIVIVIIGIIASVVSVFLVQPVKDYFNNLSRSEIVDTVDNAVRLTAREIRSALPNSVRVSADSLAIEFIPTVAGARYRTEINSAGDQPLVFDSIDTSFDVFGSPVGVTSGQWMVVYNLGTGITSSDAYAPNGTAAQQATSNRRLITGVTPNTWTISSLASLPSIDFSAPYRVYAVAQPITYVCDLVAKTLTRWSGYSFNASIAAVPAGTSSIVATNVTTCGFSYDTSVVSQSAGLAIMRIGISKPSATGTMDNVVLYHTVHVSNLP